jgi:hypothetical protein
MKKEMAQVYQHDLSCRKKGEMVLLKTTPNGLCTRLKFKCFKCQREINVATHAKEERDELNTAAVWGTLAAGICYEQAQELLSHISIHLMCYNTFVKIENKLGKVCFY